MPTEFPRSRNRPAARPPPQRPPLAGSDRIVDLAIGSRRLPLLLAATPTADRIWMALPLYSTAEPWGDVVHFTLPIRSGRERGARTNGLLGEVYYWPDEQRLILPFGPTPISRIGEIRLPQPINAVGRLIDDVEALRAVRPGEKVSLERRIS